MINSLVINGGAGTLVLGYKDAVILRSWQIAKVGEQWMLTGAVARADPYLSRLRPLYFSAPRQGLPPWCWGVEKLDIGPGRLQAVLGPPER